MPPSNSVHPTSVTDGSTKSSGSEIGSFEEYGASQRGFCLPPPAKTPVSSSSSNMPSAARFMRRRRRLSTNANTTSINLDSQSQQPQQHRGPSTRRRFSEGVVQKRATLPASGSCDSGYCMPRQPVQLCRQHLQTLEQHLEGKQ